MNHKHKKDNTARNMILLALGFVLLAMALCITAGASAGELVQTRLNVAVDLGAPVYQYTEEGNQPQEGELKKSEAVTPSVGSRFGTILCERIGLKAPLYYGDSKEILTRGAGQYTGSGLPGEGRPILAGAHDSGYFAPLQNIKKDDIIKVNTSYGEFQYKVTDLTVKNASSITKKDLEHTGEELVLYTCWPFGPLTEEKTQRYFVAAEKIAGPVLVEDEYEK